MKQMLDCAAAVMAALCYLGYLWTSDKFCKLYLQISQKKERLFLAFSFGIWLLLNIADSHFPAPYIVLMLLCRLLFAGFVILFFTGGYGEKILAASLLMTVMTLVKTFCESFLYCLVLFFSHSAGISWTDWADDLIACIALGIAAWAVYRLSGRRLSVFDYGGGRWCAVLAIPLLIIVIVIDAAGQGATNGILLRSGGWLGSYYDQLLSNAGFCVLTFLGLFAAGAYVFGIDRIFFEQKKSSRYYLQIAVYQMLEEQYSRSERLRHDMKNHIIALSGLFQNKEWEKMGDYLESLESSCLERSADITGNRSVDALLYHKRTQAEKNNVKWECDVQMPVPCCINEFDFCILFGNVLDNALEACERMQRRDADCAKRSFITVQAKTVKKCFFLTVKNSVDMAEQYKEGTTGKVNPREHGIGLLNVRDVVRRYHGAIHMESGNGIFAISVLIPLNAAAHNKEQAV